MTNSSRTTEEDLKKVQAALDEWFSSGSAHIQLANAAKEIGELIEKNRKESQLSWLDLNTPIQRY
ncbi:hypothetical protein [Pseudomonas amygdali]|uniref:Uncharacterized protein n=1 Tax=Pseudomonas amygdali pv. lachrymans str. M301315 TaxID=629260 RepID=A0AAD0M4E5_PSEAV|nr:hypothetical protein [Pseudomonas amygdali]AXH59467.1 hypothetical protein PLA107_030025 [Pseudomonas amygdali pv. lachrymans str. M301315]RMT06217.1 hypothetical protein ALP54_03395 [Pseudomonas amygdali pv. lachrymans]